MLKKSDVYSFIDKVQRKAIDSLKAKYVVDLDKAIEDSLNEPENRVLKHAIQQVESSVSMGVEARKVIRKTIPRCDRWNNYFTQSDIKKGLFEDDYNFPDGFDNIRLIHAEHKETLRKTKEEYAKIMRMCQNKKTGEQGKTALIALGFDVAYLDKLSNLPVVVNPSTMDIDKTLIFPCGETGIE